jgi:L-ribulose-5-phosphate 3-epimerase
MTPNTPATTTPPRLEAGAITDEFSPTLDVALDAMAQVGLTSVELRMVDGKNIVDLTDDEVDEARRKVHARGMRIVGIASPVLKCVLPDAPPVDSRFQQDTFGSRHQFADQPRLAARAFEVAHRLGAPIIRVFSFWRTTDPGQCFERVCDALRQLAEDAMPAGLIIGLENEHACNIATGEETARVMNAVDHPALRVIWDPANALVAGERPFPGGYNRLPKQRIVHVHAKDCIVNAGAPTWGPLGEMDVDWAGQIAALAADGYRGAIHLETHWHGPDGDKLAGSVICGRNLRDLIAQAP